MPCSTLNIGSDGLKKIAELKYLGTIINSDGSLTRKIVRRIVFGGNALTELKKKKNLEELCILFKV